MRRQSWVGRDVLGLIGLVVVVVLALPKAANALTVGVKLEPGIAIPLSAPQSQIYDVGAGESLKILFGINRYLDVGPDAFFLFIPAEQKQAASGSVWGVGGGLRLKRPHDATTAHGVSPWFESDLFYIQTGEITRPGFDAALGLQAPFGKSRSVWLGPFVRYLQVIQPDHAGFDDRDAKILTVGLSFEIGIRAALQSPAAPAATAVWAPPEVRTVTQQVISCADNDGDGIPDTIDR